MADDSVGVLKLLRKIIALVDKLKLNHDIIYIESPSIPRCILTSLVAAMYLLRAAAARTLSQERGGHRCNVYAQDKQD